MADKKRCVVTGLGLICGVLWGVISSVYRNQVER